MESIKLWAVINTDFNEVCLTGTVINEKTELDFVNVGKALFDTKAQAQKYARKLRFKECKVFPVLLSLRA